VTAYRCKHGALLPLLCRTGDLQVSDAGKVEYFAEQVRKGVEFRPVKVVVDLGGFYSVSGVEDQILVAASLTAGFDHIPVKIICSPWGPRR
jgi:hypothetical protein